jgi:hypothetical protein
MSLLYFNSQQSYRIKEGSGNDPPYLDCIESAYARTNTFISVAQLVGRLRQSHHDIIGAVLIISSTSELFELIQNRELLGDIPIFLILPVEDPEMISLGHSLSPRYLTSIDHNDMEIRQVLVQFVQKLKEQCRNDRYRMAIQADDQG